MKTARKIICCFISAPCTVPYTQHGVYFHFDRQLDSNDSTVEHSEVISLTCDEGFQLMGPETIRCWYGEWAVNKMPKCLPGKPPEFRVSRLKGYPKAMSYSEKTHGNL